jgi:hypothetical protein
LPVASVSTPVKSIARLSPSASTRSSGFVDNVSVCFVSAVPLRLMVPLCSAVPEPMAVPDGLCG